MISKSLLIVVSYRSFTIDVRTRTLEVWTRAITASIYFYLKRTREREREREKRKKRYSFLSLISSTLLRMNEFFFSIEKDTGDIVLLKSSKERMMNDKINSHISRRA